MKILPNQPPSVNAPMETLIVFISLTILLLLSLIAFKTLSKGPTESTELKEELRRLQADFQRQTTESRQEVRQHIASVQDQIIKGMTATGHTAQQAQKSAQDLLQKESERSQKLIEDITSKLTHLERTNQQVLDYSSQLQQLQNILKNPKQRGVIGEYWLETLLGNVLPKDSYATQYKLDRQDQAGPEFIADAVIFVDKLIIPIDAKFSLENYNRMIDEQDLEKKTKLEGDFKKDIQQRILETSKYIQPNRGTTDFAFMFVPAEGVYYHLINAEIGSGVNSQNLLDYAFRHKVMIVAPMSFYAYLQTVLFGLNQLHIESQALEIKARVEELRRHLHSYADGFRKLGHYLGLAVSTYNKTGSELRKVDKDLQRITLGRSTEEGTLALDTVTDTPSEQE